MPATHVLVVANRTAPCPGLHEHLRDLTPDSVHVVAPALNARAAHYVSDTQAAERAAAERLAATVALLREAGLRATGEVGDAKPILAIEDALAVFPATALLLSTWPAGRSHWLERGLLDQAGRFALPVTHLPSCFSLDEPDVRLQPAA